MQRLHNLRYRYIKKVVWIKSLKKIAYNERERSITQTSSLFRCERSMSGYNVILITCIFWALISEYEKRSNKFLTSLLFSELCCCIPCNKKYFNLFLIGSWTTTSWGIYHREFSVTIPSWNICKFGVFLNIGVRGTHGIQPGK